MENETNISQNMPQILLIFLWEMLFSKCWNVHCHICRQIGEPRHILTFEEQGLFGRLLIFNNYLIVSPVSPSYFCYIDISLKVPQSQLFLEVPCIYC
ncbi:hypothetical protein DPEC_G00145640 [Dallia pectoralis]|uniref:Uncharacterized protein n=1 Tax=Dallia pectoralis TaxID=75939 RepID=A0ACC2GNY7_DALPE|nr:hypothetical protein DPEC_G00145640 [Dallia pectoralis]